MAKVILNSREIFGNVHLGEEGSNMHDYSTDEQIVGTWIDGRTVYEKTYSTTMASGATTCDVAFTDITDFDCVLNLFGLFDNAIPLNLQGSVKGSENPHCTLVSLSQYKDYGYIQNSGVRVSRQSANEYSASPSVIIVVRYLKTA